MIRTHAALCTTLDEFEATQFSDWEATVEETSQSKLRQPLLTRNDDPDSARYKLLGVNFDPELIRLLREVKYLEILGVTVPASAHELNKSVEIFRVLIGNLELIVGKYNEMILTMIEVERPLFAAQLKSIDALLEQARSPRSSSSLPRRARLVH